jgi:YebC/PmpR family DNA-binding regulatory protein
MSGHSKWSTIKHKKAKTDAARSKQFTKLIREITVAARQGGSDIDANPRLRLAVQAAKGANMPSDNITRAVKKGAGEIEGVHYEEFSYEGYGPAGVGLIIDVVTDNRNRTTAEVRHALTKHGGNMGETGSVAWNFAAKGVIRVVAERCDEETVMNAVLDSGAEDVQESEGTFEVYCVPADLASVSEWFRSRDIPLDSVEIEKIPKTLVELDGEEARRMLRLMEALEDLDDVARVSANFDIPDEAFQED